MIKIFWGGTLQLHKAIEGANFGGVGPGISPITALALGLKVDVDALPQSLQNALRQGKVNLNDPAVTLALLKPKAVVGVTGFSNPDGSLHSVGIQCSLCHSTVDNSLLPGIGHRLDGWANRDLNVGAIVAASPNLQPVADLLGTDVATVLKVLNAWGPGKFDAELLMDGKGFRPDGTPAATLIPPACRSVQFRSCFARSDAGEGRLVKLVAGGMPKLGSHCNSKIRIPSESSVAQKCRCAVSVALIRGWPTFPASGKCRGFTQLSLQHR